MFSVTNSKKVLLLNYLETNFIFHLLTFLLYMKLPHQQDIDDQSWQHLRRPSQCMYINEPIVGTSIFFGL